MSKEPLENRYYELQARIALLQKRAIVKNRGDADYPPEALSLWEELSALEDKQPALKELCFLDRNTANNKKRETDLLGTRFGYMMLFTAALIVFYSYKGDVYNYWFPPAPTSELVHFLNEKQRASILVSKAETAFEKAQYEDAVALFTEIAANYEEKGDWYNINLAIAYFQLANALEELELYELAEKFIRRDIEISQKKHGLFHRDVAISYEALALNLEKQGKTEQAGNSFQKLIEITRESDNIEQEERNSFYQGYINFLTKISSYKKAHEYRLELVETR